MGHWRRRFKRSRLAGLSNAPRSGLPRADDGARLLHTVLRARPGRTPRSWNVRIVAALTRISKSTVQRYCALFGVQPHRTMSFKLSTCAFSEG